jgi:starch synthase
VKVLFASAEFSPLVRTGGLGDAVSGLAKALVGLGHEVAVATPGYAETVPEGERRPVWHSRTYDGVEVLQWLGAEFDRPGIYGPEPGSAYEDNWLRFGAFSLAAAEVASDYDVVHGHDAHVGVAMLATAVPSVFTIHNASYPMLGPLDEVRALAGIALEQRGSIEWFGEANYLKAGISGADQVTTVSPGHAVELTRDETSFGLGGIVRSLDSPILGILNGIDVTSWDPRSDGALAATFSASRPQRRGRNRRALLAELELADGFVFSNVGRMARQKGLQLLDYDLDALVAEGNRFVFVGNGELDDLVDRWTVRHPGSVVHRPFDENLARRVFSGSDAYLMPSEYEPCGLGQMYAMRYGAPTVAHFTGGLEDTVVDIDENEADGTGFVFRSFDHPSLTKTIRRASRYYRALPTLWERIRRNGMERDWSWEHSAQEYARVYERVIGPG